MFAGVVTATLRRGELEEGIRFVHELYEGTVIPFVRQAAGYRGAFTLFDRGLGTATSIVLYETEADAHHLDPGGEQWTRLFAAIGPERRQRLESLMSEPLHRRIQEVTLRDTI